MDIYYKNPRIAEFCADDKIAKKELDEIGAKTLKKRIKQIINAENIEQLWNAPGDYHWLAGDRKGQIACKVTKSKRLVFVPMDAETIQIIEITDYH